MVSTKLGGRKMTGKPAELVDGLIVKEGAHGRRTYSGNAKRMLVELCKAPGVSVAGLALAHGINANLLRRWIVRYGGEAVSPADRGAERRVALRPVKIIELSPPSPATTAGSIELTFRSATIRIVGTVDARALATVLDCLAARA
jgi:transposase